MKYTRMLCWTTQESKDELVSLAGKNQIIFVDNYKDFKKNLSNETYPAISLMIAHENPKCLKELIKNFPNFTFRIIDDGMSPFPKEVVDFFFDVARGFHCFDEKDLIKDFKKVQKG